MFDTGNEVPKPQWSLIT